MSSDDDLSAELQIAASVRQKAEEIADLPLSELVDGLKTLIPNDLLSSDPDLLDFFDKTKRNLARQLAWEELIVAYSSYSRKPDRNNSLRAFRELRRICRLYDVSIAHSKLLAELARIFDEDLDAPPLQLIIKRRKLNRKDAIRRSKEIRYLKTKGKQQKLFYQVALHMYATGETLENAIASVARSVDGSNPASKEETVRKAWQANAKPYRRDGRNTITLWPENIPVKIALPAKGRRPKKG
jgi:hypothetical protein